MKKKLRSTLPAVVVLAIVALGGFVISPAFGGPGFLTTKKAKKLFVTKKSAKSFLTTSSADGTYLSKASAAGTYVTKAAADSSYLPASGNIRLAVPPSALVAASGGGSVSYFSNETDLHGASSGIFFNAPITVPVTLQGHALRLNSVELCYSATLAPATLDAIFLFVGGVVKLEDDTNRHDNACRTYAPANPVALGPNDWVILVLRTAFSSASQIEVTSVAANLSD
jgi:hypothetical protein